MPQSHRLLLATAVLLSPLAACKSYPSRTRGAYSDFQSGQLLAAVNSYSDTDVTGSEFLSGVEAGTVALAAGDWTGAEQSLMRAVEVTAELDRRALLSLTDAAQALESWTFNDTAREYMGEGFERVYLHSCLALTYLGMGRLDDLWVETRLANRLLEREEELYEASYGAGGLGHFLSALTYELQGQLDEAFIDYRRMEQKGVGGELVGRSLVRLATVQNREDVLGELVESWGSDYDRPEDAASVVVIGGIGLGPIKEASSLVVPTGDGFFKLAVPAYVEGPQPVSGMQLLVGSHSVETVEIENVSRVAKANLKDRLAWVVTKSIARGAIKLGITRNLKDHGSGLGFVAGNLYTLFSERADLRGWQSLPHSWHAGRVFLEPGVHQLQLAASGGETVDLGTYKLDPGETMIILARSVGQTLYAYPIGGLDLSSPGQP